MLFMTIKISLKSILYVFLALIVISSVYILILVSNSPIDHGPRSLPEGPIWGFWNENNNKSFYFFANNSVYSGYGKNYTRYTHN
jgi:hypothetical protein